jgi:hypothetical protein
MMKNSKFFDHCVIARDYILNDPIFNDIYIGVFRSFNGVPDFYVCNHIEWMAEYISKELWYIDPIVKDGLLTPEVDKETLLSWGMSLTDTGFQEYRTAYIGEVKGFSKVFKHSLPEGTETIVIGIGLYPKNISIDKPLKVNAMFRTAEEKIKEFLDMKGSTPRAG